MLVGSKKAGEDQPGYNQVRKMVAKWMAKGGMVEEAREAEGAAEVEPENDVCARCGDVSSWQAGAVPAPMFRCARAHLTAFGVQRAT